MSKTVRVIVLKSHEYDEKPRQIGEIYEANPKFLKILTGLGRVKVAEAEEAETQTPSRVEPSRREYRRRDMKAEK